MYFYFLSHRFKLHPTIQLKKKIERNSVISDLSAIDLLNEHFDVVFFLYIFSETTENVAFGGLLKVLEHLENSFEENMTYKCQGKINIASSHRILNLKVKTILREHRTHVVIFSSY